MDKLIKRAELLTLVPMSAPTIYRNIQRGLFPRPVKIGPQHVAWRLSQVEQWMADLPLAGGSAMDMAKGSGERANVLRKSGKTTMA